MSVFTEEYLHDAHKHSVSNFNEIMGQRFAYGFIACLFVYHVIWLNGPTKTIL